MNPQSLKLLLVSQDRDTLRGISRFLQRFGYEVQSLADLSRAMERMQGNRPDLLIVDWDARDPQCRELCRMAGGDRRREYVYTLLMADEPEPAELIEAIQTGVDDFLSRPAVYGELLARLRAGARVLEYERRVRQQAGWDPLTGLLSRTAFLARLEEVATGTELACVLFETDGWEDTRCAGGQAAADRLLEGVAGSLEKLGGPYEALARLRDGHFAALLPDTDEAAAVEWADQVRENVRQTEFAGDSESFNLRTTLTVGVAARAERPSGPDGLLQQADDALDLAKRSGGDCVVSYSQCDLEDERWQRLAEPGKLLQGTLARHVMTPSTLTLRPEHTMSKAAALFRRTGLSAIPVVEIDGRLQGLLVHPAEATSAPEEALEGPVRDMMAADVTWFSEDTPFAVLMDHLLETSEDAVVIVDGEVPTGLVTRQGLLALIHPLTTESFAPHCPFVPASDYLLVPDLCPAVSV